MANSLVGRTWTLDTASTTVNIISTPVRIISMEWSPAAADNDLVVKDGSGNPLWVIRAKTGAPNNEDYAIEKWTNPSPEVPFHGLRLHTIDGGTLYVTIA